MAYADSDDEAMAPTHECALTNVTQECETGGMSVDVVFTLASPTDQVASRLPPLNVPVGECVAITMLASVRRLDGTSSASTSLPMNGCEVDGGTRYPSMPVQLARQRASKSEHLRENEASGCGEWRLLRYTVNPTRGGPLDLDVVFGGGER